MLHKKGIASTLYTLAQGILQVALTKFLVGMVTVLGLRLKCSPTDQIHNWQMRRNMLLCHWRKCRHRIMKTCQMQWPCQLHCVTISEFLHLQIKNKGPLLPLAWYLKATTMRLTLSWDTNVRRKMVVAPVHTTNSTLLIQSTDRSSLTSFFHFHSVQPPPEDR